MPQQKTVVTSQQEEIVPTAIDGAGNEVRAGDDVTLKLRVRRIDIVMHPETGEESHQNLELCELKETGYLAPFAVVDSRKCRKATESAGRPTASA